jgi:hypothetical protein
VPNYTLPHPKGYYVVKDEGTYTLCRPDGVRLLQVNNSPAWECEVTLAAFEDHNERLVSDGIVTHLKHR